jgi:hypothetical protein
MGRRRRFYVEQSGKLPPWPLLVGMAGGFATVFLSPWLWPFRIGLIGEAVLYACLALWLIGWSRFGWLLTRRGLAELRFGWWRVIPWERMQSINLTEDHARLTLTDGDLILDRRVAGWVALALAIERRLAGAPEPQPPPEIELSPEQVAAWLGLPEGQALHCPSRLGRSLLVVGAGLLGFIALLNWRAGLPWLPWFVLGFYGVEALVIWFSVNREVRATPEALEVKQRGRVRRYAWGGLWRLQQYSPTFKGLDEPAEARAPGRLRRWFDRHLRHWLLETRDGQVLLPFWLGHREPLLAVIRQALAAREAGQALPRMAGDVPDSALSRAAAGVDAGRGLSRDEEAG